MWRELAEEPVRASLSGKRRPPAERPAAQRGLGRQGPWSVQAQAGPEAPAPDNVATYQLKEASLFPNPQDALPLPPHPDAEHYRQRAKDLVRACRSGENDAVRRWSDDWMHALIALLPLTGLRRPESFVADMAPQIAEYAARQLARSCKLSDALHVVAILHGFASWPKFADHLDALDHSLYVPDFENAAEAVIRGDAAALSQLLHRHPQLAQARSARNHNATLLHYVSANGVEGYRQKSPPNAAAMARILLDAGAAVDAQAAVYGGEMTTLGLVATSAPPAQAGVQIELIDLLIERGANFDQNNSAGNNRSLIHDCLANGQWEAAQHLAQRGSHLDLAAAAGIGRLDVAATQLPSAISADPGKPLRNAFWLACGYGQAAIVGLFLDRGMPVDAELQGHGSGHTGLHAASFYGHGPVVHILLSHRANVHAIDRTWGTSPLKWAIAGWLERKGIDPKRYYDVVSQLLLAGATVDPEILTWETVRADPEMQRLLARRV